MSDENKNPRHRIEDVFPVLLAMQEGQNLLNERLTRHMEGEEKHAREVNLMLRSLQDGQEVLLSCRLNAFPKDKNGEPDILGHCDYHMEKILEAENAKKFWQRQRERISDKAMDVLLMGFVAILLYAAHAWFGDVVIEAIKASAGK